MSTSADFPANCLTNIHILHDFAEIAYIVCTHAIPASTDNATDANSPAKILDRLRNAEKQFRQNSILVALDAEKLELFTFYRKVDVVKDQRTILSKFGYVCRLNSCIISAKSAARVLDLLKPDSNRIYRLFTSAVLSSIQILPKHSEKTISIGTRVYLVPTIDESKSQASKTTAFSPEWQLYRVNVQVIATGQLVLMVQTAKNALLASLSDSEDESIVKSPPNGSLLYLLPTGQIAKYSGGVRGSKNDLIDNLKLSDKSSQKETSVALAQIVVVSKWLKVNYPVHFTGLHELGTWIQIEIAVYENEEDTITGSSKPITWRSLMWPAKMVCVFKKSPELRIASKETAIDTDPLRLALEWCNDLSEKNNHLSHILSSKEIKDEMDDEHVFADDVHFGDQYNPQAFGPPTFPASQMVYPTPPEAVLTHQTPGMSSVDGLAPTPAPIPNVSQPEVEPFLDEEMTDVHNQHPDHVGSGFYDEDLFEEMPDDKYAPNTDADEPNWDFFDPPGFAPSNVVAEHSEAIPNLPDERSDQAVNDDEFPPLNVHVNGKDLVGNLELSKMSPGNIESVYAQGLTTSPTMLEFNQHVGDPFSPVSNRKFAAANDSQIESDKQGAKSYMARRRSSVFEGVPFHVSPSDHDFRYHKHGKFWFHNEPQRTSEETPNAATIQEKRPSSSHSDTSMTSDASSSNASSSIENRYPTSNKRTWTEYHPESPIDERDQNKDVDQIHIEADTESLLETVGTASGEDPFLIKIELFPSVRRRPKYSPQKTLMVAQILVDQVSQSSLLRNEYGMQLHHKEEYLQVELSMDHSGARSTINRATLADLTSIPPRTTVKVFYLGNRLICANRAENEILAKQSILPFWDILGLQPYNESKDLTAFCIHPKSTNVADGCVTFLNRLSDTYGSCNLGNHVVGQLTGLTTDGLLAWTPQSTPGPSLTQLCQRFGSAAGESDLAANTTVVVYMISPSRDASCYRDICHAFTLLYEAYLESTNGLKGNIELVLQIVPIDFVASPETVVVPGQCSYLELAFEVYNRVPRQHLDIATASCGSVVILEKHRVRDPVFELNNLVISPLSKDGPCLHLAYAYSTDKRWLTAAWTDERGLIAFTMSYCLSIVGAKTHSKRDVFRSLWDVSHDIMSRSRVKWRLVVTHVGFYELEDMGEWQYVNSQGAEDRKMMSRLLLLSAELNPDISIEAPGSAMKSMQHHPVVQASNTAGTPVTTPQANHTTSPDQIVAATPTSGGVPQTNVATPPEHTLDSGPDMETTLIDPTDQSWAVSLAFGLNQSSNFLDIRPAAASGLLIKRTGSKEDNKTLRSIGLSLVAAPRLQPTSMGMLERESILQEMMEQYRGLVTLAVSRGCIDKSLDCVPWHVATVVKGSRVLGEAM